MKNLIITFCILFLIPIFSQATSQDMTALLAQEKSHSSLLEQRAGKCGTYTDKQGQIQEGCSNDFAHGMIIGLVGGLVGSFGGTSGTAAGAVAGFGIGYLWSYSMVSP